MSAAAARASASSSEPPSAPGTPVIIGVGDAAPAGTQEKRKRVPRPKIDIDAKIQDLSKDIFAAQKLLKDAKTHQRNERRKKQRLVKKAATLSSTDLERIAVIKRCGLWEPGQRVAFAFPLSGHTPAGSAAAAVESVAVSATAGPEAAAAPPPVPPPARDEESDVEEAAADRM